METRADRMAVDVSLLLIRIVLGVVFLFHGGQLLFGLFGGGGIQATVNGAGGKPGMGPVGYLVAVGQFFGGMGILLGVLTRFSAAALIVIMLGAIFMVHLKNGFSRPGGRLRVQSRADRLGASHPHCGTGAVHARPCASLPGSNRRTAAPGDRIVSGEWWAQVNSNHRPLPYQGSALTN